MQRHKEGRCGEKTPTENGKQSERERKDREKVKRQREVERGAPRQTVEVEVRGHLRQDSEAERGGTSRRRQERSEETQASRAPPRVGQGARVT